MGKEKGNAAGGEDTKAARSSVARRSMLGCAASEGRKEASEKEKRPYPSLSLFHPFPRPCHPLFLVLSRSSTLLLFRIALPSSSSGNVLPLEPVAAPRGRLRASEG